jgi:hypothetical protein
LIYDKLLNTRTSDPFVPLVRRYGETDSPSLRVDLGLRRLLDRAHCRSLQRDLAEFASPWEVRSVTDQLGETLPDTPGLYMFVWRPDFAFQMASDSKPEGPLQVLYIGQAGGGRNSSGTLRGRYKGYRKYLNGNPEEIWTDGAIPTRREGILARYLPLRPLEYWCSEVEDSSRVSLLEDRLIKLLNPPLNINQGPRLRPQSAQPAFKSEA